MAVKKLYKTELERREQKKEEFLNEAYKDNPGALKDYKALTNGRIFKSGHFKITLKTPLFRLDI